MQVASGQQEVAAVAANLVDDAVGDDQGGLAVAGAGPGLLGLARLCGCARARPRARARSCARSRARSCTRSCTRAVFRFLPLSSSGGAWFWTARLDASRLSGARFSGGDFRMLREPVLAHAAQVMLLPAPIPALPSLAGGGTSGV